MIRYTISLDDSILEQSACKSSETAKKQNLDHFVGVNKMVRSLFPALLLLHQPPGTIPPAPFQPPNPPITTIFSESTTEHITNLINGRLLTMSLGFCTKVTRKVAKIGYPRKAARRFARICFVLMALTCGLFGLFEREKAPFYLIAGAEVSATGARAGMHLPAISSIRR